MTSDIQLVQGQFGDTIQILILKVDGEPDNLEDYNNIRLKLTTIDFSTVIYDLVKTDPEIDTSQFTQGIINWIPSSVNPVPAPGDYWLQAFRESTTIQNKPVRKFYLQVTRIA